MEPLASGIFNSFRPTSRSSVGRASRSLSRKLKPSATPSFSSNFFTPSPRDIKGKGRATDVTSESTQRQVQDCQTWACSNSRHSVFCQSSSLNSLREGEIIKPRPRLRTKRLTRNHSHRPLRTVEPLRDSSSSSGSPVIQCRHVASQATASVQRTRWSKPLRRPPDIDANFRTAIAQSEWTQESFNALENGYAQVVELSARIPKKSRVEGCFLLAKLLERWCIEGMDADTIRRWAQKLHDLIKTAHNDLLLTKPENRRLSAMAHAFQDNIPRTISMMSMQHNDCTFLTSRTAKVDFPVYTATLCALARYRSIEEAYRFYLQLVNLPEHHRYFSQSGFGRMIAQTSNAFEIAKSFRTVPEDWENATQLTIRSLLEHDKPDLAYQSVQAAGRTHSKLSPDLLYFTCKTLARIRHVDQANEMYSSFPYLEDSYEYMKLGLYLASQTGNRDVAEKCFAGVTRIRPAKRDDIAAMLWMHAKAGDVDAVKQVFDQQFPVNADGTRQRQPNEVHYTSALYAHSLTGNSDGLAHWLQDMQSAGLKPNIQIFTIVIQTFARLGDIQAISEVLTEMRNVGVNPSLVTYTVIISYFAKRKDASSARKIYDMAIEQGVTPDTIMTRALLDAYAESGDWTSVSDLFTRLSHLPMQPGIEVYNILLKAFVSVGAPFPLVFNLFRELKERDLVPDKYTYATFIQSACAAQRLDIAFKTHRDMVLLEEENTRLKLVSLQSMTNIMHALLATGDREQAKAVYDEMLSRGFTPSATTFSSIIKAYGYNATRAKNQEGLAISENFVDSILSTKANAMNPTKPGRKLPLNQLFTALMSPHVYRADTYEVERLYQKFLEEGGQDSVAILFNLLEVYRRANLLSKAMAIWPRIIQLAEGVDLFPHTEYSFTTTFRSIQAPLSTYIDVLSRSGRHDLVLPVWQGLESKGFVADSHNWNHLVVALIRAAQPVRAFQVIEQVLLVSEKQLSKDRALVRTLSLDMTPAERQAVLDQVDSATSFKPRHGSKAQVKAQVFMKHFFNKQRSEPPEHDANIVKADFAYPLRVMQAIQPNWNEWKPHNVVLRYCLIVLLKLQQGYLPLAVPGPIRKTGDLAAQDATSHHPDAAQALLKELEESVPSTLKRVRDFGVTEKKRLGSEEYERRYIWR